MVRWVNKWMTESQLVTIYVSEDISDLESVSTCLVILGLVFDVALNRESRDDKAVIGQYTGDNACVTDVKWLAS